MSVDDLGSKFSIISKKNESLGQKIFENFKKFIRNQADTNFG